jgi:ankyrin repeat protein
MKKPTSQEVCQAIAQGNFAKWAKKWKIDEKAQKELLTSLPNKDQWGVGKGGWTPLHFAVIQGKLNQVPKNLLDEEALLIPDKEGWTPLHLAIFHEHLDQIPKELLTEKTLLAPNKAKDTALHIAAKKGLLGDLPRGIFTKASLLLPNTNGCTALHFAAHSGHLHQIPKELLIEETLLAKDRDGWTPLHYSVEQNRLDDQELPKEAVTLSTLLTHDGWGRTPLHYIKMDNHTEKTIQKLSGKMDLSSLKGLEEALKSGIKNCMAKWDPEAFPYAWALRVVKEDIRNRHKKALTHALKTSLHPDL